jgi:lipoprotein-releasing system permease protein
MKVHTRIALRYIFTLRSFQFITVITVISMIGIIIGVAALISVISIFNGFAEFTESQMIEFDPHLRVSASRGDWIENPDEMLRKINSLEEVEIASSIIQRRVVAIKNNKMQVLELQAVRSDQIDHVSGIRKTMVLGRFDIEQKNRLPGIVIGGGVSNTFRALPGDTISLLSPEIIERSIVRGSRQSGINTIITGVFQTHQRDYDNLYCYVDHSLGSRLFKAPQNAATSIDIRLKDIEKTEEIAKKIQNMLPKNVEVLTWYDLHRELYNIMALERLAAFVVLSLIIVIAVFNILASLSMTVVEKRKDIALLKAIGANDKMIRNLFISEGAIIGLLSTLLGTALGLILSFGQKEYGWFALDTGKYLINAIPVSVNLMDIIIIFFFSLFLATIATIYPARRAAKTEITLGLRNE